jgi:hypothetical protein
MAQEGTRPPSFVVLVNEASRVHFTYRRYLENRLREEFDLGGTAVVLHFRSKAGSTAAAQAATQPDPRGTLDRKFSGSKPARRYKKPKPGTKTGGRKRPGAGEPGRGRTGAGRAGKSKPPAGWTGVAGGRG